MKTEARQLINVLEGERIRRQLDHRAFSTLLGIHESYWHRIRTGERPLNLNILTILMQKLPDVTPEVIVYIMRQGNDGEAEKPSRKTGVKKTSPYLGHGNPETPPKKPSKNASGG